MSACMYVCASIYLKNKQYQLKMKPHKKKLLWNVQPSYSKRLSNAAAANTNQNSQSFWCVTRVPSVRRAYTAARLKPNQTIDHNMTYNSVLLYCGLETHTHTHTPVSNNWHGVLQYAAMALFHPSIAKCNKTPETKPNVKIYTPTTKWHKLNDDRPTRTNSSNRILVLPEAFNGKKKSFPFDGRPP